MESYIQFMIVYFINFQPIPFNKFPQFLIRIKLHIAVGV